MAMFVFIPHSLINERLRISYLLGYWQITKNNILVNCTATVERNNNEDESLYQLLNIKSQGDGKQNIRLLGLLYSSSEEKYLNTQILRTYLHDVQLILRVNELSGSFHIESAIVNNFTHELDIRVIIYDGCSIAKSQLLPLTKKLSDPNHFQESFISFLIETNRNFVNNSCNYLNHEVSLNSANVSDFTQYDEDGTFSVLVSRFIFVAVWVISYFYRLVFTLFEWWPSYLVNMMLLTALGQQFHQRYLHCASLFADFTANIPLSVKCKNLICAILIDLFCGCLVTYAFLNTNISDVMLNSAILQTNDIVSGLQNLINWLMGVPAGLKLNIPLNNALGKFFLYHIYLWESYMMVVQPLFAFIFKMSTIIGIFGLTFILSLLSDLISLATIHIYCFYGYATRLYGYQVMSLSALWRLFRGKKWNPLRQRIDSYTYNVHQLYLGTLIFTVLLFLLPTVMVYYFVFTCLRILVLIIQGLMSRIINIVTICPMYSAISRLMNSSETTGDVYFTVFNAEGVLTLSMQASQIPLKDVIQLTLPDLKKYQEVLTWKEFISCIIWGKIVYPL